MANLFSTKILYILPQSILAHISTHQFDEHELNPSKEITEDRSPSLFLEQLFLGFSRYIQVRKGGVAGK